MKKIEYLFLLITCFIVALMRRPATRIPANPKKVCVVQLAKLGDMVCTTPMFAAIKAKYPQTEVWVMGNAINKELLEGHPHIDGYLTWPTSIRTAIHDFKKERFEAIVMTAPHPDALIAAYLSGATCIVVPKVLGGWSPYETRAYKILRSLAIVKPHTMGQYAPREYLRLLEPLGIFTEDTTKLLTFIGREKALAVIEALKKNASRVIGVSAGAGNKIKEWPPERLAAIADYVIERYNATVILFGGPGDAKEATAVMSFVRHADKVHNTQGMLSVNDLKAYISLLDLYISVDSGPIYVAEAFNIPTVDIMGPMDENEQPPRGVIHERVLPSRTKPQLHIMNARIYDKAEATRQIMSISAQDVMRAIDRALTKDLPI